MGDSFGLAIPSRKAQEVFYELRKLDLIDNELEPNRTMGLVAIPLIREPTSSELQRLRLLCADLSYEKKEFIQRPSTHTSLRESTSSIIPSALAQEVPRSFDIIGDIAVVELPMALRKFESDIGKAILRANPNLRLVLRKSSSTAGTYRTRRFERIAGHGSTETEHREYSCRYKLDVAAVYFSPRLSTERLRIARQTKAGETVVDMFAGVGPYSILIARLQPQAKVCAIDLNPEAIKYLQENIMINKVADRVIPIPGDAASLSTGWLEASADRIIMNLPSEARRYILPATRILKNRGIIHYYCFAERHADPISLEDEFRKEIEKQGRTVDSILHSKAIKEVSSTKVQFGIDARVT